MARVQQHDPRNTTMLSIPHTQRVPRNDTVEEGKTVRDTKEAWTVVAVGLFLGRSWWLQTTNGIGDGDGAQQVDSSLDNGRWGTTMVLDFPRDRDIGLNRLIDFLFK